MTPERFQFPFVALLSMKALISEEWGSLSAKRVYRLTKRLIILKSVVTYCSLRVK